MLTVVASSCRFYVNKCDRPHAALGWASFTLVTTILCLKLIGLRSFPGRTDGRCELWGARLEMALAPLPYISLALCLAKPKAIEVSGCFQLSPQFHP